MNDLTDSFETASALMLPQDSRGNYIEELRFPVGMCGSSCGVDDPFEARLGAVQHI